MICLVETRGNKELVDCFCAKFPQNWEWAVILADGYSRGILVSWNKTMGRVSPIVASHRALHLIISHGSSGNWIITVVYNAFQLHS